MELDTSLVNTNLFLIENLKESIRSALKISDVDDRRRAIHSARVAAKAVAFPNQQVVLDYLTKAHSYCNRREAGKVGLYLHRALQSVIQTTSNNG